MGGSVSTGRDNSELVDNLVEADYIQTALVEKVFRAIDRADYFLPEARKGAYRDTAWKSGNLHLSAPCIYSKVMEALDLQGGLSFLNIGSGTGYLSTMVGLILGTYGVNHGVEIHKDVINYAYDKLEEFKRKSFALDENHFCEPKFVHSNGLCLAPEMRLYDRIYCGARCPESALGYMKKLLKINGILVVPVNDHLLKIKREASDTFDTKTLLAVSFASLIPPSPEDSLQTIKTIETEPIQLQAACRALIRSILRDNIEFEYPEIKQQPTRKSSKRPRKKPQLNEFVIPMFEVLDRELLSSSPNIMIPRIRDLEAVVPCKTHNRKTDESMSSGGSTSSSNSSDSSVHIGCSDINNSSSSSSSDSSSSSNSSSDSDSDNDDEPNDMDIATDSDTNFAFKFDSCDSYNSEAENCDDNMGTTTLPAYMSPYTIHMREKIQALPLPPSLKSYVNYFRSFE